MREAPAEPRPAEEARPAPSRESLRGAGWQCVSPGTYLALVPERSRPLKWLDAVTLWRSRNDAVARRLGDPTNDRRRAWMRGRDGDLVVDRGGADGVSFLVMGDTGEGDASQYAVVPPLLSQAEGTDFLFICSDVIYPAGEVNQYEDRFYRPYKDYPGPIYAVPGNHDWYDGLSGFMFHFCGADRPPAAPRGARLLSKAWLRDRLWRRPAEPDPMAVARMRALRPAPEQRSSQPGPYFAIDAGPLRLVCVDTGITGVLDRDQGEWLRRVSAGSGRPKILLTGKPLYVDGRHVPGSIEGGGTVDEVVRAPEHRYLAAIGGDIHNYQRYPVRVAGRTIQYVVSGGGGAFTHATHTIPKIDPAAAGGVTEREFRCYPLRGDSLSFYSRLWDRRLGLGLGRLTIHPDEAAAIMAERLGIPPRRDSARRVEASDRARRAAGIICPLPGRARGPLHLPFSEFFDWNDPPLFKSFLRIDAGPDEIRVRCFAATGCLEHEAGPPVEVELRAERAPSGEWAWTQPAG